MEKFDDIVLPIGSGGTACGLALANHLTGSRLRYIIPNNQKHTLEFCLCSLV